MSQSPEIYDVAIIGGGPAGLSAASELIKHNIKIILLDEQPRPGGQITRQPPKNFYVKNWLKGRLYTELKKLLLHMENHTRVNWKLSVMVTGITKTDKNYFQVCFQDQSEFTQLTARKILICTGCYERPLSFPGSSIPGVMGTGAIQSFLKSQQILPGKKFIFAGTHPLQLIVAEQVIAAGGQVDIVAFAQPLSRIFSILHYPSIPFTHWRIFLAALNSLIHLKRSGVKVLFGYAVKSVKGTRCIDNIHLSPIRPKGTIDKNRKTHIITADRLGLCYGFQASSELARQAGAKSYWSTNRGGWLINHNNWMETSQTGIFVAGEITNMAGATAGMEEGKIAGTAIALSLGLISTKVALQEIQRPRQKLASHNHFADYLSKFSRLPSELSATLRTEDSLLCRCESITCGDVKKILAANPYLSKADSIKLLTRVGMGLCQGRLCYANFADLVVQEQGSHIKNLGPFHAQWPIKPILISELLPPRD